MRRIRVRDMRDRVPRRQRLWQDRRAGQGPLVALVAVPAARVVCVVIRRGGRGVREVLVLGVVLVLEGRGVRVRVRDGGGVHVCVALAAPGATRALGLLLVRRRAAPIRVVVRMRGVRGVVQSIRRS